MASQQTADMYGLVGASIHSGLVAKWYSVSLRYFVPRRAQMNS